MPKCRLPRRAACALLAAALFATTAQAAEPPPRPRIGLVLGGGGARGAAHIGVLETLERLRVPVDCVAGTSMGALVAGAWASGVDAPAMRRELAAADWADLFQDNPDYTELSLRTKRLAQRFLPGTETGFTVRGLVSPPGVVAGQKIKLFFNRLVRVDAGERDIARLPLPLSIVATDIATGQRVVLREGSLAQAMRASMAVPGLMAPMDLGGRRLVDGGLVDNVPIREVRERCQADVVIAVNVGSPLLAAESIAGLLSVSAQMVAILTEQNVAQSLATLTPNDIYIQPDLGPITAADFDRHAEAADRGRAAAEAVAGALGRLSVSPEDYARWQRRFETAPHTPPLVDEIEVTGLARVSPGLVLRHLRQRLGAALDVARLEADLVRAYGDGHYEGVDYSLVPRGGRHVLRIAPVEKRWGPDYLRMAVSLNSNFSQGSTFALRAAYQKTWINRLGGELLFSGELGTYSGAGVEWYQPLDALQDFFFSAATSYRRERRDIFQDGNRISEYTLASGTTDLVAGVNLGLVGQLQLGRRWIYRKGTLDTGLPLLPEDSIRLNGWLLQADLDQLNRLYVPSRGWATSASYFESQQRDYGRLNLEGRVAHEIGAWVVGARASYVGSPRGQLPFYDAGSLGGFLNLSGFASGQLVGDHVRYVHLRGERIVGRLPLGLRGDMRLGLALEAGRVGTPYTETNRRRWLDSTTVYLAGETPLGPVALGIGHSSAGAGSTNAYLQIGTP
jgi:NTE family protein